MPKKYFGSMQSSKAKNDSNCEGKDSGCGHSPKDLFQPKPSAAAHKYSSDRCILMTYIFNDKLVKI